jgi:alkylglycerol monooxygenase
VDAVEERYLALAVPFFVVSIAGEALVSWRLGKRFYRLHDGIASLGCGIGQTLLGFWLNVVVVTVFAFVGSFAPWQLPGDSALVWIASLIGVDFFHYWFHRSSHRVSFLWAGHAVHHQSEDYNLTTALRQSWLEPLMSLPFYLPLALLGVPLGVFVATHTLQTLYQYWIHTRLIGKLGAAERVLNTPSNHRVHHAINPEYIDKNYAGIFILWDRLFGTYTPERAEPAYGVVKPLGSFDPFRANLAEWARIAAMSYASGTRREALYAFIAPPEWRPRSLGGSAEVPPLDPSRRLFDTRPGAAVDRYVAVQFALVLLSTGALLARAASLGPTWRTASILWLLLALGTFGGLLHVERWAWPVEKLRVALAPLLLGGIFGPPGVVVGVAFAGLSSLLGPRRPR